MSFRHRTSIARIINDQYLEDKLDLKGVSNLLSMELRPLQREVYQMLPLQDREDHQYLIYEKPKPIPPPMELYIAGDINIQTYEDLINPGR